MFRESKTKLISRSLLGQDLVGTAVGKIRNKS